MVGLSAKMEAAGKHKADTNLLAIMHTLFNEQASIIEAHWFQESLSQIVYDSVMVC